MAAVALHTVYQGQPVAAIVRETHAHGWPHPPTTPEAMGLENSLGRIVLPGSPARRTTCEPLLFTSAAKWTCISSKPSGYGIATRVRVFEDGSYRATVYAVLGPVVRR